MTRRRARASRSTTAPEDTAAYDTTCSERPAGESVLRPEPTVTGPFSRSQAAMLVRPPRPPAGRAHRRTRPAGSSGRITGRPPLTHPGTALQVRGPRPCASGPRDPPPGTSRPHLRRLVPGRSRPPVSGRPRSGRRPATSTAVAAGIPRSEPHERPMFPFRESPSRGIPVGDRALRRHRPGTGVRGVRRSRPQPRHPARRVPHDRTGA